MNGLDADEPDSGASALDGAPPGDPLPVPAARAPSRPPLPPHGRPDGRRDPGEVAAIQFHADVALAPSQALEAELADLAAERVDVTDAQEPLDGAVAAHAAHELAPAP